MSTTHTETCCPTLPGRVKPASTSPSTTTSREHPLRNPFGCRVLFLLCHHVVLRLDVQHDGLGVHWQRRDRDGPPGENVHERLVPLCHTSCVPDVRRLFVVNHFGESLQLLGFVETTHCFITTTIFRSFLDNSAPLLIPFPNWLLLFFRAWTEQDDLHHVDQEVRPVDSLDIQRPPVGSGKRGGKMMTGVITTSGTRETST